MPLQTIEISFITGSCSEKFRILHVWKTENALIVASKLHCGGAFGLASLGRAHDMVTVEVDHELPVKHYAIGVANDSNENWMRDYHPICIKRETDIPQSERQHCLYESPKSDSYDRVNDAVFRAKDDGGCRILKHDSNSYTDRRLLDMCKDSNVVRRILEQENHSHEDKILALSLYTQYDTIMSMEMEHEINHEEADLALKQLFLSREDGAKLESFKCAYMPLFDKEYERRRHAEREEFIKERAARESSRIKHDMPRELNTNNNSSLQIFGMFAGAAALVVTTYVACNNLSKLG